MLGRILCAPTDALAVHRGELMGLRAHKANLASSAMGFGELVSMSTAFEGPPRATVSDERQAPRREHACEREGRVVARPRDTALQRPHHASAR